MHYLSEKYDLSVFEFYRGLQFVQDREAVVEEYRGGVVFPHGKEHAAGVYREDEIEANSIVERIDEEVAFLGNLEVPHFGCDFVFHLSRLWWNNTDNMKWVYVSGNGYTPNYLWIFLRLLGLSEENVVKITVPTLFSCVYVPEESFMHGRYILPVYGNIYARMYQNMPRVEGVNAYEKIYLTRCRLKRKKEIGEKRFERFFEVNGYKVIAPEQLPLSHQAFLCHNAKVIASVEGTHAHGVMWRDMRNENGGQQIILRKQSEFIPGQMMMDELWHVGLTFIDVFEEPFRGFPISHDRGPFLLKWTEQIDQFAKDNNMIVPDECRKGFVRDIVEYTIKCAFYRIKHTLKRLQVKLLNR